MTAGIVVGPAVYLVGDLMDRLSVGRVYATIFCSVFELISLFCRQCPVHWVSIVCKEVMRNVADVDLTQYKRPGSTASSNESTEVEICEYRTNNTNIREVWIPTLTWALNA